MTRGVFNIHAHNGGITGHPLRPKANFVNTVFQHFFQRGRTFIFIMRTDRTHQRFFRQQRRRFNGGRHAHADQQRRTRVQTVAGHHVENKAGNAFITRARHQHHRFPRQGTAAASHIGINAALVRIGDNLPEHRRRAFTHVFAGIVFIKSLNAVVAQRGIHGRFNHRFTQQRFQLADQREVSPALHQKLNHAGILAGRAIQLLCQTLVLNHGRKDNVSQFTGLFLMQIFQFCSDVIR